MTTESKVRIALTPGEPAGIGPDLCIKISQTSPNFCLVFIADPDILDQRAQALNLPFHYTLWEERKSKPTGIFVKPIQAARQVTPGKLDKENVKYVLQTLQYAAEACLSGEFDALVTGPVHKGIINDAGFKFSGHTEFLAKIAGTNQVVMMLMTDGLKIALATTHVPLSEVSKILNIEKLSSVIRIVEAGLRSHFGLSKPRISICGLNPHAGEQGHLGREEIEIIEPVISELKKEGLQLTGPVSADSAFTEDALRKTDAVLTMYHDQGLPVLKHIGFGKSVNITLGLPFVRTSVDHGTALSLAGTGQADSGSLEHALSVARKLVGAK